MAMYGATIGKLSMLGIPGCTNQACCVLTKSPYFENRYLFYWFLANRQHIISLAYGGGQPNISQDLIRSLRVTTPPLDEQKHIVCFLDKKTLLIDDTILKKQQLIELLQEERTALINQAVTRGLNPDVKMKASGVEWLGDVPEHWIVKRLKHISPSISVGLVINPSSYHDESGTVPLITGRNVEPYRINTDVSNKITAESNQLLANTQLHSGDIVTIRVGYPGVSAVVPLELDGINCASMMIVRRGNYDSNFLCYCLNSNLGKIQVEMVQYGAAQKQFNISHAIDFFFPTPPLEEQVRISEYLTSEAAMIDSTMEQINKEILLLQEYRTALINEVVTGKRCVIPIPQEALA
jgi:type I restriction enzyme S subunit